MIKFDIHDRVNYAVEKSFLNVDEATKQITLELTDRHRHLPGDGVLRDLHDAHAGVAQGGASSSGTTFGLTVNGNRLTSTDRRRMQVKLNHRGSSRRRRMVPRAFAGAASAGPQPALRGRHPVRDAGRCATRTRAIREDYQREMHEGGPAARDVRRRGRRTTPRRSAIWAAGRTPRSTARAAAGTRLPRSRCGACTTRIRRRNSGSTDNRDSYWAHAFNDGDRRRSTRRAAALPDFGKEPADRRREAGQAPRPASATTRRSRA